MWHCVWLSSLSLSLSWTITDELHTCAHLYDHEWRSRIKHMETSSSRRASSVFRYLLIGLLFPRFPWKRPHQDDETSLSSSLLPVGNCLNLSHLQGPSTFCICDTHVHMIQLQVTVGLRLSLLFLKRRQVIGLTAFACACGRSNMVYINDVDMPFHRDKIKIFW